MGKNIRGISLAWLVAYNVIQTLGWSYMGIKIVNHFLTNQTNIGLFKEVEMFLLIFQTAAILEIVHTLIGIVRSNIVLTTIQVFSRVFIVWGILMTVEESQECIGFAMLLTAWTITEIIRYSFYAFGLFNSVPYFIMWLRYTLFIFLYPIGVTGECLAIYTSLEPVKNKELFYFAMPNSLNFVFNYYYVLCSTSILYLTNFPSLYLHMFAQRKKNLDVSNKGSKIN